MSEREWETETHTYTICEAGKMAQWIKVLVASKPDDLSLTPRIDTMKAGQ